MRSFLLIALFAALGRPAGAAVLREASGLVQVRPAGSERWSPAGKTPRALQAGDALRTGFNARAVVVFGDGVAAVEAAGNTQLSLDEPVRGGVSISLLFGSARVTARALGGRPLELRTPTATAKARSEGASFRVAVGGGGNSVIEVSDGLVAVEDVRGGALRVREGERVEADLAGLHEPGAVPSPARVRREEFADRMRRELAWDRGTDALPRLVAGELRRSEYESGHLLADASGARVRVEEFVVRQSPSSFASVTLNGRRGAGLSWYSWSGTFDRALPKDLSSVFQSLPGTLDAPTSWTLTGYTETRSNGVDRLTAVASGGHQVDLNHNADPTDDVTSLYDPSRDVFVPVGVGRAAFKTLFDNYALRADGVLKSGWTGANIQAQSQATPLTGVTTNTTFPDAGSVRQVVYNSYVSDGSFLQVDSRAVAPGGGVVSRSAFGGATSGPAWDAGLLRSAFQQTATATEFGGRSIDLVVSPRVLVERGALP